MAFIDRAGTNTTEESKSIGMELFRLYNKQSVDIKNGIYHMEDFFPGLLEELERYNLQDVFDSYTQQ